MKKLIALALALCTLVMVFAGCGSKPASSTPGSSSTPAGSSKNDEITVISREDGSGTRGAFIELFGVEEKDSSGKKIDKTVATADITNSTSVMMTSVAQNKAAIGYISLGSLNSTVKALKIDGAAATVANIKSGTYKISRPFNIATKATVSAVAQDFINYILSSDGQAIVEKSGYISASTAGAYSGTKSSGKIVVAGSSSVSPVMEKLKEAYLKVNTNATIEIQTSDSTTGVTSATKGICDIGMASRELKSSELDAGIKGTKIALDGIAVIVNTSSKVEGMTSEQVKKIYTGAITKWSQI